MDSITLDKNISEGRFPRYQRWRLEASEPVTQASFLVAISPRRDQVQSAEDAILLPQGGGIRLGPSLRSALGVECECECLLWDATSHCITAMGLRSLRHNAHQLAFDTPVDIEYNTVTGEGKIYAQGVLQPQHMLGYSIRHWRPVAEQGWKTHNSHRASFVKSDNSSRKEGHKA